MNKILSLLILSLLLFSCSSENEPEDPDKLLFGNNWKDEIDYSNPDKYLNSGEQSKLNSENEKIIRENISINKTDFTGIVKVIMFKEKYFTGYEGGGAFIGKLTINDLFKDKKLSGCHDHALVVAGMLRLFGYPVIMAEAADINWAKNFKNDPNSSFIGHVLLEVYVNNEWILLDPTGGLFSAIYDYGSPVIKTQFRESKGELYVLFKGLDTNEYGIYDNEELHDQLKAFANNIDKINLEGAVYNYTHYLDYFISEINSFDKKYKINLTINYKYTGKNIVDSNHQIIIQLDHFKNGMPIINTKVDMAEGTVIFNDIFVAVESIYLIGWLDIDSSGSASHGDPTLRQTDANNNPIPILISNGPVEINVEFDDSILWQQK